LEEKEEDEKKKEEKEKKKPNEKTEKKITAAPKKKTVEEIQSIKDAENRMKQIRKNFMKLHNQEEREEYLLTLDKISYKFQHEQCK
jgi:diphthamide synthase subunit DPH2